MSEIIRFIIFASIGAFNTVLDIGIWNILYRLFNKIGFKVKLGFFPISNYIIAHTFSFGIASLSSYFLNNTLTFSDSTNGVFEINKFYSFFGVTIFTFGITTIILNILTSKQFVLFINPHLAKFERKFGLKKNSIKNLWPTIAKVLTIGVGTFTNFFGYRLLVF